MGIIIPLGRRFRQVLSFLRMPAVFFIAVCINSAHAQDGYYDSTFSQGGITYFDFGPPEAPDNAVDDVASSVAVMHDGRLVVAGNSTDTSFTNGATKYAITRLLPNGGIDSTFTLPFGAKVVGACAMSFFLSPELPESHALGVALQADGKVVVGGYCRDRGNAIQGPRQAYIARHNADGSRDPATGDGLAAFPSPYTGQFSTGRAVAVQPDGKIVLIGDVRNSVTGLAHWFVARFYADLTRDGTAHVFDVFFKNTPYGDADAGDYAYAVAIQTDGMILVAGTGTESGLFGGTVDLIAVMRLTTALTLDPTFNFDSPFNPGGTPGFYVANGSKLAGGTSLAIDRRDDSFVVGGYCDGSTPSSSIYCFHKFSSNGVPFSSFGFDFNRAGQHVAHAVVIQADGKILLSGRVDLGGGNDVIGTVRCCADDGYSPDPTFGAGGYSLAGYQDEQRSLSTIGYGMVLQNNHPVVVGSMDYYSVYPEEGTDFVVTRLYNEQILADGFEEFQ